MIDKVVYTALFGDYENLKEPLVITPGWKYICLTDQKLTSNAWQVIQSNYAEPKDNCQNVARWFKIMKYEGAQSLWLDASFQINTNLDDFWNKHYKGGICAPKHPARACAHREAQVCMRMGLDTERVQKQITRYANQGLPYNAGLISSGILMRDNSQPVKDFCSLWWEQILNGSLRDQIGFAYTDWKMPGIANTFSYDYRVRQEFIYTKHYHKR